MMVGNRSSTRIGQGSRMVVRPVTLVEILISILLLTILAVVSGTYLAHSGGSARIQNCRRAAVETGNSELERIMAADFADIAPPEDFSMYYLARIDEETWDVSSSDPGWTTTINGRDFPVVITVQYQDRDGGFSTYDYLDINIRVGYLSGDDDYVGLQTRRSRWE
jgi:type II secretory pathway pseudopilin PulG